ncbi:MAG: hypothetical protein IT204_26080 [Fimbriimonadaceae bacterium]|nr:hypothetical protein [Fimbriimonadaceae bacterium]
MKIGVYVAAGTIWLFSACAQTAAPDPATKALDALQAEARLVDDLWLVHEPDLAASYYPVRFTNGDNLLLNMAFRGDPGAGPPSGHFACRVALRRATGVDGQLWGGLEFRTNPGSGLRSAWDEPAGDGLVLPAGTALVGYLRSPDPGTAVKVVIGRPSDDLQVSAHLTATAGWAPFRIALPQGGRVTTITWLLSEATAAPARLRSSSGNLATLDLDAVRLALPERPPQWPLFLRSFALHTPPEATPGILHGVAYTYDTAVAITALASSTRPADQLLARRLADGLVRVLHAAAGPRPRALLTGYCAGPVGLYPTQPIKRAGSWNPGQRRYDLDLHASGLDVGNNAWAALALLSMAERTGNTVYREAAEELFAWIDTNRHPQSGFYGGWTGFDQKQRKAWRSTEHNLDVAALAVRLAAHLPADRPRYQAAYEQATRLVKQAWQGDRLAAGFTPEPGSVVNLEPRPIDPQTWYPLVYGADEQAAAGLRWVDQSARVEEQGRLLGVSFAGFRYGPGEAAGLKGDPARLRGVWNEGLGQWIVSAAKLGGEFRTAVTAGQPALARSQLPDGAFLAADRELWTGLRTDVGFDSRGHPIAVDWLYYPSPAVAATAWAALALRAEPWNPYYDQPAAAAVPTLPAPRDWRHVAWQTPPAPAGLPTPSPAPDWQEVSLEGLPAEVDQALLLPARTLADLVGGQLTSAGPSSWRLSAAGRQVVVWLGDRQAQTAERPSTMATAPRILDGQLYLSVGVLPALGASVTVRETGLAISHGQRHRLVGTPPSSALLARCWDLINAAPEGAGWLAARPFAAALLRFYRADGAAQGQLKKRRYDRLFGPRPDAQEQLLLDSAWALNDCGAAAFIVAKAACSVDREAARAAGRLLATEFALSEVMDPQGGFYWWPLVSARNELPGWLTQ